MLHKNILYKLAIVKTNQYLGKSIKVYEPCITEDFSEKMIWEELKNIIDEENILSNIKHLYDYKISVGDFISKLEIGCSFFIYDETLPRSGGRCLRTSEVVKIFNPNLFLTRNSLYFLKDESYQLKEERDYKLNKILIKQ